MDLSKSRFIGLGLPLAASVLFLTQVTGFLYPAHGAVTIDESIQIRYKTQFGVGRMGAGCPAGWQVKGNNFHWSAEDEAGPLGPGAAKIRFEKNGEIQIFSPACFLKPAENYRVAIWIRSSANNAVVSIRLCDNDTDETAGFEKVMNGENQWRFLSIEGPIAPAVRDCYYLTLTAKGEDCNLWLDGLWFQKEDTKGAHDSFVSPYPAAVTLTPLAPWGLVNGDDPMFIGVAAAGVMKNCHLRMRAFHTNGMTAELPCVPLDSKGIWKGELEITDKVAKYFGMIRLEARVVDPNGKCLSPMSETLLARAPRPLAGFRQNSPFGVHVSLRETDLQVMKNLGYQWLRIHDASAITKWAFVEPEQGKWQWFDQQVSLARKQGFCILGMLDSAPAWESQTSHSGYFGIYGAPQHIDNWARYVRTTVGHYAGQIDFWEVWNEPWNMTSEGFFQGGSPALYVQLLKTACQEAKSVNPASTILGINTLPAFWDQAVLKMGAFPYYDVLSWHLYDAELQGQPDDNISAMVGRLDEEQRKYGTPKPQICSEGGPGLSSWHGSFFSFADPALSGDWSRGADQLARMYLGCITRSVQKFFLYTVHQDFRYGKAHYHATETGPLLKPMHLTVSALAYYIDGAEYRESWKPTADIIMHIFRHMEDRAFAQAPSTVVVLMANGQDAEDIPFAIPPGFECYDRWGNRTGVPAQAQRGPAYLVASGTQQEKMLAALRKLCGKEIVYSFEDKTVEALIDTTVLTLKEAPASLWKLFSTQESLLTAGISNKTIFLRRKELRDTNPQVISGLPKDLFLSNKKVKKGNHFALGWFTIESKNSSTDAREWILLFSAAQNRSKKTWRYICLTILPFDANRPTGDIREAISILRRWEDALSGKNKFILHDTLNTSVFCGVFPSFLNAGIEVFSYPHHCLAALQEWLKHDKSLKFAFAPTLQMAEGNLAVFGGELNFTPQAVNLILPVKSYYFNITMVRDGINWKIVSIGMCPALPET